MNEECPHEWKEVESQWNNDRYQMMKCIDCGMSGELDLNTQEVYFPAT